jgi:hypothetical protein
LTKPRPTQRPLPHASAEREILRFTLRFTRSRDAADPYEFRFGGQQYICQREDGRVRVATLDWNDELLAELEEAATPGANPAVVQRLGNRLRKFLETTDWPRYEERITRVVTSAGPRQGVEITIISNAAELYALPWEFLTLEATGQHLGELPDVMFRYAWPGTATTPERPSSRSDRWRVLLAWSESNGAVPHQDHRTEIRKTCERAGISFRPDRDELPRVSYARLGDAIAEADRGGAAVILHLLCHGVVDRDTVALGFHGEYDRTDVVDAARLRQLLAPYAHCIRLVVLCACHSGNPGVLGNHLGSIAQNLHRVGIQAVIASRFPLSLRASTCFTGSFYDALLVGHVGVEKAFQVSRTMVLRETSGRDWGSLQLYAQSEHSAAPQMDAAPRSRSGLRLSFAVLGMAGVLTIALAAWCNERQDHSTALIENLLSDPGLPVPDAGLSERSPVFRADVTPQQSRERGGEQPQQPPPLPSTAPAPRKKVRGTRTGRQPSPLLPDAGPLPSVPVVPREPDPAVEMTARQASKSYHELRSDIHVASISKKYDLVLQLCEDIQRFPTDAWVPEVCGEAACETRAHDKARFYYVRMNKRSKNRIRPLCERKDIHLDG